jgi:hypothetical protein
MTRVLLAVLFSVAACTKAKPHVASHRDGPQSPFTIELVERSRTNSTADLTVVVHKRVAGAALHLRWNLPDGMAISALPQAIDTDFVGDWSFPATISFTADAQLHDAVLVAESSAAGSRAVAKVAYRFGREAIRLPEVAVIPIDVQAGVVRLADAAPATFGVDVRPGIPLPSNDTTR